MMKFFQRLGKALMLPVACLPVCGILMGIGYILAPAAMAGEVQGFTAGGFSYSIGLFLIKAGGALIDNMSWLFAIGVAVGMAEDGDGTAGLAGLVSMFMITTLLSSGSVAGITGKEAAPAFGKIVNQFVGILSGLIGSFCYNKYRTIKLPDALAFFSGKRAVAIFTAMYSILAALVLFFVWPLVYGGLVTMGETFIGMGAIGAGIYTFFNRLLIPFGLHHVFYLPFWQTGLGGSAVIDGALVYGAQNIFFAELASPSTTVFSVSATRFMSGKFPLMIFGLPGAALAMYVCAKPGKKKAAGGLLLSAALTSIITGITEPLEFTFLFVAPAMYFIHSIFAGLAYMLMHILRVGVGMTFSGGIIDLFLFGILQGNAKTNWVMIIPVGIAYFAIYFFIFRFMIKKFNYITPGREEDTAETKLYRRADLEAKKAAAADGATDVAGVESDLPTVSEAAAEVSSVSAMILEGLGGKENIQNLDCCATRLRVTVVTPEKVSDVMLKRSGAAGVIKHGDGIQVVYGPQVSVIKSELEDYMNSKS